MAAKYLLKCKRTRIENCKGHKIDPAESYGKWAYWCGNERLPAWRSQPCNCGTQVFSRDGVPTEDWERKSVNELGMEYFGSKEELRRWCNQPVMMLENQRPIDVMRQPGTGTGPGGLERVKNVLLALIGGAY